MTAPLALPELPLDSIAPSPDSLPRRRRILFSVAGLLMFCPLVFGTVDPWSSFILQATSVVLLVVWALDQMRSSRVNVRGSPLFPPMIAFAGLMCIQLLPGVSAYWHATFSQLLLYVSFGILCFLLVQTLTSIREVRTLVTALVIYGSSVAVFAVVQNLSAPTKLYWLITPRLGGWIYGPYVNHNHYAGLMEMLIPVPLVFAFSRFARGRERWIAASAAALMGATIFLSGSRGGMMAFAIQLGVLLYFLFRERQSEGTGFLLGGFLLLSLTAVAWIGGNNVSARISTLEGDRRSELTRDI